MKENKYHTSNKKHILTVKQLQRLLNENESAQADKWVEDSGGRFICEMSIKRKVRTGLPMTIWIDDTKTYVNGGHWKRIKFQLDKGEPNPHLFGVMDLDGNIRAPKGRIRGLSASDISELRNFVHNNKKALERIADIEIDMDYIWPYMIMGGKLASEEEIQTLNSKVDELMDKTKH